MTIKELAAKSLREELKLAYGAPTESLSEADQYEQYKQTQKLLEQLMSPGTHRRVPKVDMSEAVFAADFKLLFPKVVQSVMQRPQEPLFLGQSLLARTVQVDGAKIMSFPSFGVIRAFEVADGQEYPEQDLAFASNATEIRTKRYGLKITISQEVIDESQWDILAMHIEAAGNAMKRLKEEKIFAEYEARSVVAFDNEDTDTSYHTSGKGADGTTKNGTFSYMDLMDMQAAMVNNEYNPTDLITHPMAWSLWQRDPILRFQLLHRGGVGANLGPVPSDLNQTPANVPMGFNVVVSPFQTMELDKTLSAGVTGPGAGNYTSVTMVDRNSSILVLERSPMNIAQWEDPMRDLITMRFAEKYGLALLNAGRSSIIAKNIRVDLNEEPVYTIKTVSV
jgi:hypothetical protein